LEATEKRVDDKVAAWTMRFPYEEVGSRASDIEGGRDCRKVRDICTGDGNGREAAPVLLLPELLVCHVTKASYLKQSGRARGGDIDKRRSSHVAVEGVKVSGNNPSSTACKIGIFKIHYLWKHLDGRLPSHDIMRLRNRGARGREAADDER